ncbi:hypothetical protein JT358_12160 [Micrococcales bacterium 31B]|nr:hypothetical protein [Micrococcales bacterium 31B]
MSSLIVAVAQYGVVAPAVAYIVLIVLTARRAPKSRMIGAAVFGLLTAGILGAICAALWLHPRPAASEAYFVAMPENAFPAWPVAGAALFTMLLLWRSRVWGWAGLAVTLLIAAARLVARVETFVDSLAGVLIGLASGFVGLTLFSVLWHRLYVAVQSTLEAERDAAAAVASGGTETPLTATEASSSVTISGTVSDALPLAPSAGSAGSGPTERPH